MILYRILWREPIVRELHDGRVVWLVQTCERWATTLEGADQIAMDLENLRVTCMVARVSVEGMNPRWVNFMARWDDGAVLEAWRMA